MTTASSRRRSPNAAFQTTLHASPSWRARGFSMVELLLVISMIGLISLMAFGRTSEMMTQWRVSRAAQAYGEELQSAFALVGRNRKPMMIVFDRSAMEIRMHDRAGVIYRRRGLGTGSAYKLDAVDFTTSRDSVEVYPPGLAADSMSVTISRNGKLRRVRMLRGGLVQICSNPAALNVVCTPA